jgi:copper transport protein
MMQERRVGRRFARAGAVVTLAFVLVGFGATAAFAHATLKNTSPPQSAVFKSGAGPRVVVLGFDENVAASPTFLKVYDGAGKAVPGVHAATQNTQSPQATLPSLPDGTFVAVWHIISADGHPEQGAFTFTVGKGSATTADINGLIAQDKASKGLGIGFGIDRALAFLGCLLFVGGLIFARFAWPEILHRSRVRLYLAVSAYVAIIASLLTIPLEAAYSTGDTKKLTDGSALGDVLSARFGTGVVWRVALLVLMLPAIVVLVRRGWSIGRGLFEGLVVLLGLGVWATFAYAGHGDTGRLVALGFSTDIAHLAAASLWLGGIVTLAVGLRGHDPTSDDATAAVRFSAIALPAIAIVVLSGITQGWRQLGSWDALWHTSYGRLLLVKAGIVVGIVIIASAARDVVQGRLIPTVRGTARPLSAAVALDSEAVTELRNGIWSEVLLAVAVLAVTSVLVFTAPGREAEAAAKQPVAHTVRTSTSTPRFRYGVEVQPAIPGPNTIVIAPTSLKHGQFLPASLDATMSVAGGKPRTVTFVALPDGRFVASTNLTAAPSRIAFSTSDGTNTDHAAATITLR